MNMEMHHYRQNKSIIYCQKYEKTIPVNVQITIIKHNAKNEKHANFVSHANFKKVSGKMLRSGRVSIPGLATYTLHMHERTMELREVKFNPDHLEYR